MYSYSVLSQLTSKDEREINLFLESYEGFAYFQSPAFFHVCKATKNFSPFYILAKHHEKIVGILLFYEQGLVNISILNRVASRSVIAGGPIVKENSNTIINELLEKYRNLNAKILYSQVRNLHDTLAYKEEFERNRFTYEEHLNYVIDLRNNEDVLWKGIHTKRRNEIRRAEKEGCAVYLETSPESLRSAYTILKEVYQRARLPLPDFTHFSALWEQSNDISGLRLFTAQWEGKIIGCMLCLAHNGTLYDYYAGAYSDYYGKYPNDLLPWEVMKWAKKNGFTRFDFGGAGKPDVPYGVRDYKKKFGGQLVNYGRYERIELPVLYTIASAGFRLLRVLKNVSYMR